VDTKEIHDINMIYEVVSRLVGPINPVGDSRIDEERLLNLKIVRGVVDRVLFDIAHVARCNKNLQEHSRKVAGEYADGFLRETTEAYTDE